MRVPPRGVHQHVPLVLPHGLYVPKETHTHTHWSVLSVFYNSVLDLCKGSGALLEEDVAPSLVACSRRQRHGHDWLGVLRQHVCMSAHRQARDSHLCPLGIRPTGANSTPPIHHEVPEIVQQLEKRDMMMMTSCNGNRTCADLVSTVAAWWDLHQLGMIFNESCCGDTGRKVLMTQYVEQKWDIGLDAPDARLGQRTCQLADSILKRGGVAGDLGHVKTRDEISAGSQQEENRRRKQDKRDRPSSALSRRRGGHVRRRAGTRCPAGSQTRPQDATRQSGLHM